MSIYCGLVIVCVQFYTTIAQVLAKVTIIHATFNYAMWLVIASPVHIISIGKCSYKVVL